MTPDEKEYKTMIAREAFDLVSVATFLLGLFLTAAAWLVLA